MSSILTATSRRTRRIVVPNVDKYQEMFTTNRERIQEFINSIQATDEMPPHHPPSRSVYDRPTWRIINAEVILDINRRAEKLSEFDFMEYLNTVDGEEYNMLLRFQNIIANDARIAKILRKKYTTEEEEIYLMNWKSTNHSNYRLNHLDMEEPYVFDENDFIR